MSIRVMSAAWDAAPYAGTKLLVLLALCDYANDEGYCWPKMKSVAKKARCSEQYARSSIREFEAARIVTVKEHRGRGHKNEYWITAPETWLSKTAHMDTQNRASGRDPRSLYEPSKEPLLEEQNIDLQRQPQEQGFGEEQQQEHAVREARPDPKPASRRKASSRGSWKKSGKSDLPRRETSKTQASMEQLDQVAGAFKPRRSK